MSEQIKKIAEKMDLDRTDKLFDVTIQRAEANNGEKPLDEDYIKQMRLVIGTGNLHLNTARVQLAAIRLIGYRDNLAQLKNAVFGRQTGG